MAQVGRGGRGTGPIVQDSTFFGAILYAELTFLCCACPFLMLHGALLMIFVFMLFAAVSPSISMSPSCCRHVSFAMLICPFLKLSPSFSFAPWRRWDGGEGHGAHRTRPDLFWCYPLCGTDFCLCCVCPFLMLHEALSIHLHVSPSISMSPSCCRHVCFLMPTGLSLMRAVSPFMPSVSFFMLICSFLMLSPSSSYAPRRRWDRGEGHGAHRTRPDLFWCYPLCGAGFFMLRLSFSYAPWGAFHPSPCLHPVVDMFVFGLRTLHFLCCSCPSCAPWWGGGGHGAHQLGRALFHGLYANQILFVAIIYTTRAVEFRAGGSGL